MYVPRVTFWTGIVLRESPVMCDATTLIEIKAEACRDGSVTAGSGTPA
jgi:hypothetical protein